MPSDAPVEQVAHTPSAVPEVTFSVGANGRRLDLVVPEGEGSRYAANEIFNLNCYEPVGGISPPARGLGHRGQCGAPAAYFRMTYPEALIHCVDPEALIHCVEPDPVAWSFLTRNEARIGNCRLHNVGLYDRDCEKSFYSASNLVLSSLTKNPVAQARPALRDASRFVADWVSSDSIW